MFKAMDPVVNSVANWGPRRERPEALADRWIFMLTNLRTVDPIFSEWYDGYRSEPRALSAMRDFDLAREIEQRVGRDDDGSAQPVYGYKWCARMNGQTSRHHLFKLHMSAGSYSPWLSNNVDMTAASVGTPGPKILSYSLFEGAILAMAEAFSATRAYVYPERLSDFWTKKPSWHPRLPLAWISYIAPRFTHLVTPPSSAIVEHRPDGGLLMAATDEPFDVDNLRHMAVAREIQAAVAPFNALPWPPEDHVA